MEEGFYIFSFSATGYFCPFREIQQFLCGCCGRYRAPSEFLPAHRKGNRPVRPWALTGPFFSARLEWGRQLHPAGPSGYLQVWQADSGSVWKVSGRNFAFRGYFRARDTTRSGWRLLRKALSGCSRCAHAHRRSADSEERAHPAPGFAAAGDSTPAHPAGKADPGGTCR